MECLLYCMMCVDLKVYGEGFAPVTEIKTEQLYVELYTYNFDEWVDNTCQPRVVELLDKAYLASQEGV